MPDRPPHPPPFHLTTAPGQQRLRIDRFLQQTLPSISRHKVHELIDAGLVLVEGKSPKKSQKIGPGERIEIFFRDQQPKDIAAEAIPLQIFFEDEWLLVVNKPAGMVTHPAHGHFSGTLVNALMHHLGMESAGGTIRPGIVHRLDKGTSGLLVVAKNEVVHRRLTEQFSARTVQREYRAIVWSRFKASTGEVDAPLGRHPGDRKRFAVVAKGGKAALTTYRVEETFEETTHLALKLKTGRTHQIRVHLEAVKHPVFGDRTYGGRSKRIGHMGGARQKFYEELFHLAGDFALHARTLGIRHPITNQDMDFTCEPPPDFILILERLRRDAYENLDSL